MTRFDAPPMLVERAVTADQVQTYLEGRGVPVDAVSTAFDRHTGYLRVTVEGEVDPTEALQAFTPNAEPVDPVLEEARAVRDGLEVQRDRTPLETLVLVLARRVLDI